MRTRWRRRARGCKLRSIAFGIGCIRTRCAAGRLEAFFPFYVKSFLQFLLFVLVITLALAGLYAWKSGQFSGGPAATAASAATHALPSVKPALGASALPGLAALDSEFGRLAEAVIPSVVSLTARKPGAVEIISGLAAGEIIVIAGQMKLFEGASVRAAGSPTAAVN